METNLSAMDLRRPQLLPRYPSVAARDHSQAQQVIFLFVPGAAEEVPLKDMPIRPGILEAVACSTFCVAIALACTTKVERSTGSATRPAQSAAKDAERWPVGATLRYDVALSSRVALVDSTNLTELKLAGQLTMASAVERNEPATKRLFIRVTEAQLDAPGAPEHQFADLGRELAQGCLLEFENDKLANLRLPAQHSEATRALFRTIASYIELGFPSVRNAEWQVELQDATGTFRVAYRALEPKSRFSLKKLGYSPIALQGPYAARLSLSLQPEVSESSGTVELMNGRLEKLVYDEELRSELANSGAMSASNHVQLTYRGASTATETAWGTMAANWPRVTDRHLVDPKLDREAFDASKIGSYTYTTALRELEANASPATTTTEPSERAQERVTKYNRAFSALSAILRQPEALRRAETRIRAGGSIANTLLQVLAATDTTDAQRVLITLVESGKLSQTLRSAAILSVLRVEHPSEATIASLMKWLNDDSLHVFAIYGLGTLSRRLRDAGQTEQAARGGNALGKHLKQAKERAERVHLLRGIANSGDPALLEAVLPLTTIDDDTLRGAALEALRLMPRPEVDEVLARRLRVEESHFALRAGLNAAKVRAPSTLLSRAVAYVAETATDTQSRYRAVKLLSNWRSQTPELEPVLARIAATDASEDVRAAAVN